MFVQSIIPLVNSAPSGSVSTFSEITLVLSMSLRIFLAQLHQFVLSNMTASITDYVSYAKQLRSTLPAKASGIECIHTVIYGKGLW
ncbi:uncharacterized protein with von Willebrand factor type A (vWA) domain [Rhizomicrobium palustre]|uniref:Uncharacterized protein with von Willebrand factor type A (VWA) domain n=1 Tax=Rhizomicrobium palustre TaxID=189966 RepID=A0A846MWJ8_9PROT|nr:uncharacterized protein with von Willebrand factor type A (vWA) domain [Rhizomicrobium palustre]